MSIEERLNELINDLTSGNQKRFAEEAKIHQKTLNNYANGRIPKADALEKICITFKVNLNWLVAGIGEKYIGAEKKNVECEFLESVDEWITELKDEDQEREVWFKVEFKKSFPEYKEWIGEKEFLRRKVREPVI